MSSPAPTTTLETLRRGFFIVAAADEAGGIGRGGRLPWSLPGDLAFFKRLTTAEVPPDPCDTSFVAPNPSPRDVRARRNVLIMGRKTWQSLPGVLPWRTHVVVTRDPHSPLPSGVVRAADFAEALAAAHARPDCGQVFAIGGAALFASALVHPELRAIYLTRVFARFDCDVVVPAFAAEALASGVVAGLTLRAVCPPRGEGGPSYQQLVFERADQKKNGPA